MRFPSFVLAVVFQCLVIMRIIDLQTALSKIEEKSGNLAAYAEQSDRKCSLLLEVTVNPDLGADGFVVLRFSPSVCRRNPCAEIFHRRRLFSAIVDSTDDAIVSKNLNGIVTSWNRGAEKLFGYSAAEMVGKPITTIKPADRLEEDPKIIERMKKGERVDHFDTKRRRKDGTLVDVSLTISPVITQSGEIVGASKIARHHDAEERRRICFAATSQT